MFTSSLPGCPRILANIKADSSLVNIPWAIGPSMNSLSVISKYLTEYQISSGNETLLFDDVGSTPRFLQFDAAHLSSAAKRIASLGNLNVSRHAISLTSLTFNSSKRSWRSTVEGSASMTFKHRRRSSVQAAAISI